MGKFCVIIILLVTLFLILAAGNPSSLKKGIPPKPSSAGIVEKSHSARKPSTWCPNSSVINMTEEEIPFFNNGRGVSMAEEDRRIFNQFADNFIKGNTGDSLTALLSQFSEDYPDGSLQDLLDDFFTKNPERSEKDEVLVKLGNSLYVAGNKELAINTLNRILEEDPTNIATLQNLGMIYEQQGEPDKYLALHNWAILTHPDNSALRQALAQYYMDRKDQEEAIYVLSCDIGINSNSTSSELIREFNDMREKALMQP